MILDAAAMDLLLSLLEAHELVFTTSSVMETNSVAGAALIKSGLLQEYDFEMAVADDDGPHEVIVDEGRGGFGYYSASEGWVSVDREHLRRYRPDLKSLFIGLLGDDLRLTAQHPKPIHSDRIWNIGSFPLIGGSLTSIWFARRLIGHDAVASLDAAIERSPSTTVRLVLTSTSNSHLVSREFNHARIIPIADVHSEAAPGTIDLGMLHRRFEGRIANPVTRPVWLSADGRRLSIAGEEFQFTGEKMIAAIGAIYGAYQKGVPIKLAEILAKADSNSRDMDSLFGSRWPGLKRYIVSEGGYYTIKLP